ncbi:MAG: GLPGLI family protein [Kaistella sp.]|nr:GLPGLI family protein [Kaistella sp.]
MYAQENLVSDYECKYLVKFQKDTTDQHSVNEEVVSLLIGGKNSLFKSSQKVIYDSLSLAEVDKSFNNAKGGIPIIDLSKIPTPKFKPEVFKKGDSVTVYNEMLKTIYSYPFHEKLIWKILNETKVVGGYICHKATTEYNNREYVAWFARDIPFSEGPYVFKGLPGLVLEVSDKSNYFSFTLIQLKKAAKPLIPINFSAQTTHSKYIKARSHFLENPVGVFESQTKFKIPQADRERLNILHRSMNNFLD